MRKLSGVLQVGFTYIGTVVGAGFASGQEILQFFTQYGKWGALTIAASTLLFIWLGSKLMLLAHDIKAYSYHDLNAYLFTEKIGRWISNFTMVLLFGGATVMLAGAGSIFSEQLHLNRQFGLLLTMLLGYWVISRGMQGIMAVNSVVVPIMLLFTAIVFIETMKGPTLNNWLRLTSDYPPSAIWLAPLLYTAFNLSMAQAVLVPLGSAIQDRSILKWGGLVGGLGIGLMLLASHISLSSQMPGIRQFDIPMGKLIEHVAPLVHLLFVLVIYAEVFTTYVADLFGMTRQLHQKLRVAPHWITLGLLGATYIISLLGFKPLLSTLYPIFGFVSLAWFMMVLWRNHSITALK